MHVFDKLFTCCLLHFEEDFAAYTMEGVTEVSNSLGGASNIEITAKDNAHKKPTNVTQL
jgi:hypothetical protein